MSELYFLGADIVEETKSFMHLSEIICTDGMTENELKAYHMGVENALSALKAIIAESDLPVININGLEIQTELSIEDLEEYYGYI
jgi:hypothetical protein